MFGVSKEEVEALRAEVTFLREAVEEVQKHTESTQPESTEAAEVEERSQARYDKITGWNKRLAARLDTVERDVASTREDVAHTRDDVATLLGEVSELAGNLSKMESRLKAVFKGLTS